MQTIIVELTDKLMNYVEAEISTGGYGSPDEVVHHALRLLEHERKAEAAEVETLRKEIQIGIDAADRGEFSERSLEDIYQDVLRQHGELGGE